MTPHATTAARRAPKPWYRERWPWLLMAGPAIVVVAGVVTALIALSTDDGLVADDYYKRGLLINKQLERTERGEALGIGAVATFAPDGAVRVELTGLADRGAAPASLRLKLAHPTRAGFDRAATLARGAAGDYAGTLEAPPPGRWLVSLETDAWRLPSVEADGALREVRLGAARKAD
jgi:uncharacterized protein